MIPIMLYYPILLRRSRKKHVGRIGPTKQILTSKKAHKWFKVTEEVWTKEGIHDHYLRPYCTVCGTPLHSAPTLLFRLFQMILTVHHYSCYSLLILFISFHALPCYSCYSLLIIWFHKFPYYSHRSPLFLTIPYCPLLSLLRIIHIIQCDIYYSLLFYAVPIISSYSYDSLLFILFPIIIIPIIQCYPCYPMLSFVVHDILYYSHYSFLFLFFRTIPWYTSYSTLLILFQSTFAISGYSCYSLFISFILCIVFPVISYCSLLLMSLRIIRNFP